VKYSIQFLKNAPVLDFPDHSNIIMEALMFHNAVEIHGPLDELKMLQLMDGLK